MKHFAVFICLVLALTACNPGPEHPDREDWISLFNGKDLTGWDIKISGHDLNENYLNTFRVADSMMVISYADYDTFGTNYGHIYYKEPFSHYRLRFEYRFTGNQTPGGATWNVRNSGVMVHSQPANSLFHDQDFPISLEMQLLGGLSDGNPRTTGNLCTPGTQVDMNGAHNTMHCINSSSDTYDGDQWLKGEMLVLGDSLIQHFINGQLVLEYDHPVINETDERAIGSYLSGDWPQGKIGKPLRDGYIALQAESHPIDFRKIELLQLKGCRNPNCPDYKSYYVVEGDCDCAAEGAVR